MDQATLDNMTAQRLVHYLVTPFSQWEAAKIGLIDSNGQLKRAPQNHSETQYFNLFHILAIRLRELLKTSGRGTSWILPSSAGQFYLGNKNLPAGNFTNWSVSNRSALPMMGAAYSSIKECVRLDDDSLFESFFKMYLEKQNQQDLNEMVCVFEDGEGSTSGMTGANVEIGQTEPIVGSIRNKYTKANLIQSLKKKKNVPI